jgi:AcrR family transcriptional regulator
MPHLGLDAATLEKETSDRSFFGAPLSAPQAHLPTPSLRKGERTAGRILDTAELVFAEKGYAGTSMRDVASAAGLRIPSLYNHFASKEALYTAVLERGIRPILEMLTAESTRKGAERELLIERIVEFLAQHPSVPRLVQHEVLAGGPHLAPMLDRWFRLAFEEAETTIRGLPGARRWGKEQIPLLVVALYHVVIGYFTLAPFYQRVIGTDLLTDVAVRRQIRFLNELVAALLPDA